MPLRRRRSHYQHVTEFERGRVVELLEGGISFRDIAERSGRNVFTVYVCWQQWSRERTERASATGMELHPTNLTSGTCMTQCMHVCMLVFKILAVKPVINIPAFHI